MTYAIGVMVGVTYGPAGYMRAGCTRACHGIEPGVMFKESLVMIRRSCKWSIFSLAHHSDDNTIHASSRGLSQQAEKLQLRI